MMRKMKALVFTLIFTMAVGASLIIPVTGFTECPDGIMGYWKLDETSGSTYADFVAGNDAVTGTGDPDPAASEGINGAQQFTAANTDGLDVPANSAFNWTSTESFSIELWVKTDGVTSAETDVFIARNAGSTALQWWIGVDKSTGAAAFRFQTNSSNVASASGTTVNVNDGSWHHLVFVRDGSADTNTLYVDGGTLGGGEEIAAPYDFPTSFTSDSLPISIGYMQPSGFHFDGYIDEVAIYGRALAPAEINSHSGSNTDYCEGSEAISIYAPYPDNTRALWPFDETSGSTYEDAFSGLHDAVTGTGDPDPAASEGINGAQQFTAANTDGLDVPANSAFNWTSTESFSIELWVKTDGVTSAETDVFIARNAGSTALQWWIGVDKSTGAAAFRFQTNSSNVASASGTTVNVNDGSWHHLVFVRDGEADTNTLYVDGGTLGGGEEIAAPYDFPTSFTSDSLPISIGYMQPSSFHFDGYIDEVAIYGRALTATDIDDHYTNGQGASGQSVTALRPSPTANAGADQNKTEGDTVTLSGSGTTYADASITGYQWTKTAGTQTVTLSDATAASPTFTAPDVAAGGETYTFSLIVTASDGQSSTADTVDVVVANSAAPTADAGPNQNVTEGDTVTLDGSASTAGGSGTLTYAWTQTDSTGLTVTLSDATAAQPTFTAPDVTAAGAVLTFQLIVSENSTASAPDTVNITVGDVTTNPDADAGADQEVTEGDTVTLDGSLSSAAAGATLASYQWTQTDSTGLTVTLSDSTAIQPTFTAPDVDSAGATLTFQLMVTDDGSRTATDTVDIVVNDATTSGGGGGGGGCFINAMF